MFTNALWFMLVLLLCGLFLFLPYVVCCNIVARYTGRFLFETLYPLDALNGAITLCIPSANRTPFLDVAEFVPELLVLEENWEIIAEEARALLASRCDAMQTRCAQIVDYGTVDKRNRGLSETGDKFWKIFPFKYYGRYIDDNCAKCPRTTEILQSLPSINLAMFSILENGKKTVPTPRTVQSDFARAFTTDRAFTRQDAHYCRWRKTLLERRAACCA
jgi:aspartyl/asparaginyl beta-hydroxylase (cupin superfamily)